MDYQATIVITTCNRREELRRAIASCLEQEGRIEVLVVDDGSSDGTAEMVRREFPQVRLERSEKTLGLIEQRHRAASLASAPIIVSIDDDAAFSSRRCVVQTLADFDHPRVGAVAIPNVDVNVDGEVRFRAPKEEGVFVCSEYRGTAHAVRRDLFLKLGGYPGYLFRQGEEAEFCIRLLEAGYVVRMGRADPVHHYVSPRRDWRQITYFGGRSAILLAWYSTPWYVLPVHWANSVVSYLRYGWRRGALGPAWRGLGAGFLSIPRQWSRRRPVRLTTWRLFRRLRASGGLPLEEIEAILPPLPDEGRR